MSNEFHGVGILGDCLAVMRLIPNGSVDMILTDLPYGTTNCRWDTIIPLEPLWREYERVAKPNAAIVLFSAQPFTTQLISSNMKHFRYCWYWVKPYATGFTFAKYQPMRRVEDICVFYRKMPKYHPQGVRRLEKPLKKTKRRVEDSVYKTGTLAREHEQIYTGYPKNVLEYGSVSNGKRLHPTQKPLELCEYLIQTYTDAGDLVLDCCAGSGTTAEACVRTLRHYIAIEQEERYFARSEYRLKSAEAEVDAIFARIRENVKKTEKMLEGICK